MHIGFEYGCQTVDDCFILTKTANKPKIYVYEKDGKFPHCHIIRLGIDGTKEVCVRLDKPKYLYHNDDHSKFSTDEKKMFIDFINSKDRFGNIRWNWFASTWNGFSQDDGSHMRRIKVPKIPDYTQLETE